MTSNPADVLEKRVKNILRYHESGGFEGSETGCTEAGHKAIALVMDQRDQLRTEIERLSAALQQSRSAVTDDMVERARQAWLESASDYNLLDVSIRAALEAALSQESAG